MMFCNEWEPYAAAWLRNLITAGHLPDGTVDTRDIRTLTTSDLAPYATCHFFAGIGGWPYALQLAGWPTTVPVWTASCPCQPFSNAGQRRGTADDRHLWPALCELIKQCRPQYVFGEQVASAIGHGWLDGVCTDLEAEGYAIGACVLGAHSVGAPHIRQRLYWVAYAGESGLAGRQRTEYPEGTTPARGLSSPWGGSPGGLDIPEMSERRRAGGATNTWGRPTEARRSGTPGGVDNATRTRRQRLSAEGGVYLAHITGPGQAGPWDDYDLLTCRDGKTRRIESGLQPLAHGVPARVGRLRAYGNAIVPQVAATFIQACMSELGVAA